MAESIDGPAIAFNSDRGGRADIWILSVSEASVDY
jgi:Tol biopolymer transport system component